MAGRDLPDWVRIGPIAAKGKSRTVKRRIKTFLRARLICSPRSALRRPGRFEDGKAAYQSGDYETALRFWRPLADQGNAEAQNGLGVAYVGGHGVPQDPAQAVLWWRKAADQGNA